VINKKQTKNITLRGLRGGLYAKYGGDRGSRAGCRRKSVMFFVCFLFITLLNYKVCDNENAMKQCNFENNYGVIA